MRNPRLTMTTPRIDPDLERRCADEQATPDEQATFARQMAVVECTYATADTRDKRLLDEWRAVLGAEGYGDWLAGTEGLPRTVSYLTGIAAIVAVLAALPHVSAAAQAHRDDLAAQTQDVLAPWPVVDGWAMQEFGSMIQGSIHNSNLAEAWRVADCALDLLDVTAVDALGDEAGAAMRTRIGKYREYFATHLSSSQAELGALTAA